MPQQRQSGDQRKHLRRPQTRRQGRNTLYHAYQKCLSSVLFKICIPFVKRSRAYLRYQIGIHKHEHGVRTVDVISSLLLDNNSFIPLKVIGDGNCLPRTASVLMFGFEDHHAEIRVRLAIEMSLHEDIYLDDTFLAQGHCGATNSVSNNYAMFSQVFKHGSRLTAEVVQAIFENEVMLTVRPNHFLGVWHVHALASVIGTRLRAVYPGLGTVANDLSRIIHPRQQRFEDVMHIMWTHTTNADRTSWWEPNHFVPLVLSSTSLLSHMSVESGEPDRDPRSKISAAHMSSNTEINESLASVRFENTEIGDKIDQQDMEVLITPLSNSSEKPCSPGLAQCSQMLAPDMPDNNQGSNSYESAEHKINKVLTTTDRRLNHADLIKDVETPATNYAPGVFVKVRHGNSMLPAKVRQVSNS